MFVEFGKYAGTGGALNIVVGFRVDVVLVHAEANGVLTGKSRAMPATQYLNMGSVAGGIGTDAGTAPTFITDGFSVPAGLSSVGGTYHWMAIQSENDATTLAWSGDNTDSRNITGLPFQPNYIFAFSTDVTQPPRMWHSSKGGDLAGRYADIGTWASNKIQAANADGFQVGSDMNVTGQSYVALCFKHVDNSCNVGYYIGLGAAGVRVIGIGTDWAPGFVLVMQWATPTGSTARGPIRFLYNNANSGMQVQSFGEVVAQCPIAFAYNQFTMECTGTAWNGLDSEYYYICMPQRLGGVLENPPAYVPPRTYSRGFGPYTGSPGDYEITKTIRRLNTQYTNLTIGDQ
jgi:hypothetical protein